MEYSHIFQIVMKHMHNNHELNVFDLLVMETSQVLLTLY